MKPHLIVALLAAAAVFPAFAYQPGDSYVPIAVGLPANDVAYSPVMNRVIVSVAASATGGNASRLAVVNPDTGTVEFTVPLGAEPSVIAASDSGRFVYVGFVGSPLIRRVNLDTRSVDLEASLGVQSGFASYPWSAESIAVAPGNPNRFAVSRRYSGLSPRHAGVVLFDGAVQRPNATPGHTGSNLIGFDADPAVLYGLNNETTEFGFRRMTVGDTGLAVAATTTVNVSFGSSFSLAQGRAYFNSGAVFDLARRIELGRIDQPGVVAANPDDGTIAVVGGSGSSFSGPYELRLYDLNRFVLVDRFPLSSVTGAPSKLVRLGNAGYALLHQASSSFSSGSTVTLLAFDPAQRPALANASTRGVVGAGDDVMIAGFVVQGTAPRSMLVRVLGPTLTSFGLTGVIDDPTLELFSGSTRIAQNDDWRAGGAAAATEVARLQLTPGFDRESIVLQSLAPGAYTAIVRAKPGQPGGVALVEVYDASAYGGDYSVGTAKTVNLSTRANVGTGGNVLITGFVIGGTLPRRVLLNGIGASLSNFGVSNALQNPKIELFQGSRKITEIDDWIDSTQFDDIVNTGNSPRDPAEPALLLTLNPGAYTAVLTGGGGASGVALAEVYDARTTQDIRFVRTSMANTFASLGYTSGGNPQKVSLVFLGGTTATLDGGPLGTFTYSVSGRNTASLNVTASNASLSGTLRFFRPGFAQFKGTVSRTGQGSQSVTGAFAIE